MTAPAIAGDYDGVWIFDDQSTSDYYLVTQNGGTLLLVGVYAAMDGWDAFVGSIGTGTQAQMRTLLSPDGTQAVFTLTFTSPTRAQMVLQSCNACDLPLATELSLVKIF